MRKRMKRVGIGDEGWEGKEEGIMERRRHK